MPVMEAAAALVATGYKAGKEWMWDYNREMWKFDREMRMETMHQRQERRNDWIDMFREDIESMVELTIQRMDSYMLLNALQLGLLFALLGEGTLMTAENPGFAVWTFELTFMASLCFLILSTWFAVHASITAHTCGVGLLLQCRQVRDYTTGVEVDATLFKFQDFELEDASTILRVPYTKRVKQAYNDGFVSAVKNQKVPYHYGPDALENFYIQERLEERSRREFAEGRTPYYRAGAEEDEDVNNNVPKNLNLKNSSNSGQIGNSKSSLSLPNTISALSFNSTGSSNSTLGGADDRNVINAPFTPSAAGLRRRQNENTKSALDTINEEQADQNKDVVLTEKSERANEERKMFANEKILAARGGNIAGKDGELRANQHWNRPTNFENLTAKGDRGVNFASMDSGRFKHLESVDPSSNTFATTKRLNLGGASGLSKEENRKMQAEYLEKVKYANMPPNLKRLAKEQNYKNQISKAPEQIVVRASHLNVFRLLQKHWQYFDAYARVANAIGTYFMMDAAMYFVVSYMIRNQRHPFLAWVVCLIYCWTSKLVGKLDLHITSRQIKWGNKKNILT